MANKLELTWYGKDEPIRVEPRLLIENTELSNTAADPETQNMLIHGDNLLALKALESKFAGQVKCIYIDPPYNTGSAFEHYDDNLEHSIWLNLMRPRLEILWNLLDGTVGSLWISIDESEQAYMRVLCDELFGRHNFVAQNVWQNDIPVKIEKLSAMRTSILLFTRKILLVLRKAEILSLCQRSKPKYIRTPITTQKDAGEAFL